MKCPKPLSSQVLEHLGYGPAAIGWPESLAWSWHGRLQKITLALKDEQNKMIKDLKNESEKLKQKGQKVGFWLKKHKNMRFWLSKQHGIYNGNREFLA